MLLGVPKDHKPSRARIDLPDPSPMRRRFGHSVVIAAFSGADAGAKVRYLNDRTEKMIAAEAGARRE